MSIPFFNVKPPMGNGPLPYLGGRTDHQPGLHLRRYSTDISGTKLYQMNSLGYRGEEFRPEAKKRIFVFGCSYTFGTGLNFEETWAFHFRKACADEWGLREDMVNLMNFAEAGASNDCVSRTLVSQCNAVRPDIAVVYFTHASRKEYISCGQTFPMGHWSASQHPRHQTDTFDLEYSNPVRSRLADELFEAAKAYYSFYSDETGLSDTLRNMLLCQYFCEAKDIEFIFASAESFQTHNPLHDRLITALDSKRYVEVSRKFIVDKAADGAHMGPQSNALFARHIFEVHKSLNYDTDQLRISWETDHRA